MHAPGGMFTFNENRETTRPMYASINPYSGAILKEFTPVTEQDLHKKLYEIDMRDGVLDGQNKRKATKCPDCEHMVSARHPACE